MGVERILRARGPPRRGPPWGRHYSSGSSRLAGSMQRLPSVSFRNPLRAMREIAELSRSLPPAALNRFDLLLATSAAPEEGLRYFARLREQHPSFFQRLTLSTAGLIYLIAVFTHSHFLSEEILEHPGWAEQLLEAADL